MNSEKKRILVVDDEEKITEVVASYLESQSYGVSVAHTGREALEKFQSQDPHLVILDLMLPDISGEEVCIAIRKTSRVPIIMLTAKVQEEDLLHGLGIGADDYITKPFSLKALGARIQAVLRRTQGDHETPLYSQTAFGDGDLEIDVDRHLVKKAGKDALLTPNEFQLLVTLAQNPQKVFTRAELIETTFGYEYDGYDRTIDSHIKNIRRKIEGDTRNPQYIQTVYGVGYTFGGE